MSAEADDILDDLFLGCALAANLEHAQIQQGWPRFGGYTSAGLSPVRNRPSQTLSRGPLQTGLAAFWTPSLTSSGGRTIRRLNLATDAMPDTPVPTQTIQVGDTVAYKLSGAPAPDARGKVLALFKTQDGNTLADVQWDKLGPPKRLNVRSLTKVGQSDTPAGVLSPPVKGEEASWLRLGPCRDSRGEPVLETRPGPIPRPGFPRCYSLVLAPIFTPQVGQKSRFRARLSPVLGCIIPTSSDATRAVGGRGLSRPFPVGIAPFATESLFDDTYRLYNPPHRLQRQP